MRFHCGVSFSWRSIKKFLIPILLGALAFFGFNFIYDNSTPLGFIQVNALENYQTWYDYNYTDLSIIENSYIDNNQVSFKQFANSIINRTDLLHKYLIAFNISSNSISNIRLFVFDDNSTYNFSVFGNSNYLKAKFDTSGSKWFYNIDVNNISNIYNHSNYLAFIDCITASTCTNSSNFTGTYNLSNYGGTINNDSNNVFHNNIFVMYYTNQTININNTYNVDSSTFFYKSLRVNNNNVEVSSSFPTYIDVVNSGGIPDDSNEVDHKSLFNKIFWFDDNTTELGVLTSIYEVLFLYCLTMILFRIFTLLKNTRW